LPHRNRTRQATGDRIGIGVAAGRFRASAEDELLRRREPPFSDAALHRAQHRIRKDAEPRILEALLDAGAVGSVFHFEPDQVVGERDAPDAGQR
jgi:hypothetical protein